MGFKNLIEIPLFLAFFAFLICDSVNVNMIIYRVCLDLGYNESECVLLGTQNPNNNTAKIEKLVEPYAANISMTHMVIDNLISAVLALFVGPWSDKFGRKPVITISLAGYTLSYVIYIILSSISSLSAWIVLLCSIPVACTGGISCLLAACMCYATDITDDSARGFRLGILEAVIAIGIFFGSLCSSYLFYSTNYPVVYTVSLLSMGLGLFYSIFFLEESVETAKERGLLKGFFQTTHIVEMVKATLKRREHYKRAIILIGVLLISIFILTINGQSAVSALFYRNKFEWSLKACTLYQSFFNLMKIFGTFFGIYFFHKFLKISESVLILDGFVAMMVSALVTGFATEGWQIYLGGTIACLGGVLGPMIRSLASKVTPSDEVGKIFALIVACENLTGLAGFPIYTAVYNKTLLTKPEVFNFLTAGLYLFAVGLTMIILLLQHKILSRMNHNQHVNLF